MKLSYLYAPQTKTTLHFACMRVYHAKERVTSNG